jgi:hypothetical protein
VNGRPRPLGDLAGDLDGVVFEPLRNPEYFACFAVDDTLVWPNGADFAPEFLRERLRPLESEANPTGRC